MNEPAGNAEKRTLISVKEQLQKKANELADLARMSETLSAKFARTEGHPSDEIKSSGKQDVTQPDLIGMFEELTTEIGGYINRIGQNLERALNTID